MCETVAMFKILRFLLTVSLVSGARILAVIPMPTYSHQITFWPIWRELSLRGHEVSLMTTDPINDPKLTNLMEVDLHNTYKHPSKLYDKLEELSSWALVGHLREMFRDVSEDFFNSKQLRQWINESRKFDLVMVETYFPEFLVLGDVFDCPRILVCSLDTSTVVHSRLGNQIHGVALPDYNLPFHGEKSISERIFATLYHIYIRMFPGYYLKNELLKKQFGDEAPSVGTLMQNVDMVFLNTIPALWDARAVGPSTISFGGLFHIKEPKPLPQDLQSFLDSATEGVVYFSLGSNIRSKNLKEPKLSTIITTLSQLPYKVLWKFEDELPTKSENVKLIKWGPQQDILRHPNIKLFITQAGLQSLEEAIYNDIPMVMLPMFGDQFVNAKRLREKEVGILVEHRPTLSGTQFKNAIIEVIENPKYKENIKKLHQLIVDQPMTGLEKVVWWTEYVIRHKGAKHLRNAILDLPLYQYYYLDVIAVFAVFFFLLYKSIFLIPFALKFIVSIIFSVTSYFFKKLPARNGDKDRRPKKD